MPRKFLTHGHINGFNMSFTFSLADYAQKIKNIVESLCRKKRERTKKILCCLKLHFLLIVVCLTSHTLVFIWRLFHSDAKSKKWWWLLIIVAIEAPKKKDFHNQLIREFIRKRPMRLIIINFTSETVTC